METNQFDGWTLALEYVKCGKAGCRRCPHGPYWYGTRHEGKKCRRKYFGKRDPRDPLKHDFRDCPPIKEEIRKPHKWDAIFSSQDATLWLALEILGLPEVHRDYQKAEEKYRTLTLENHPDRGGDSRKQMYLNSAWSYVKASLKPARTR